MPQPADGTPPSPPSPEGRRGFVRRFLDGNRRLSWRLEAALPQAREILYDRYEETVGQYMAARADQMVVDVGAGRSSCIARFRDLSSGTRIVGVDVSAEELQHNPDLDEGRVADITRELPFEDGEVDLLVSRSVLEHLSDVGAFVGEVARVLKPGGVTVHITPNRLAPFALINRSLPHSLSQRVLYLFHPQVVDACGFKAYYRRCSPGALTGAFRKEGLEVVERRVSYYQSRYFDFFFPAYLLSALYERVVELMGVEALSAYILLIARKPS